MAQTFEQFLKAITAEQAKRLKSRAMQWFLSQVKDLLLMNTADEHAEKEGGADPEGYAQGTQTSFGNSLYGKMILYVYNAKWKDKLPYWDAYPLVFPLIPNVARPGSFLGLNLHYLPYAERAKLMTALLTTLNNKNMNARTRLQISYDILEGASKFRLFRPCLKMYLLSHIKSKIIVIAPEHWDKVLLMPIARWQKASEYKVWADSMAMVRKPTRQKKKKKSRR